MRNPQTVSITWIPFPQKKPKYDNVYLVTFKNGSSKCIQRAVWRGKKFCVIEDPAYYGWDFCQNIIAYAELPEPYREEE